MADNTSSAGRPAMDGDPVLVERADIEREIAGRTLCDLLDDNADRHGDAVALENSIRLAGQRVYTARFR